MRVLEQLYPQRVFFYFEEIAGIPHGSQNTKAISDYLVNFAKNHSLECYRDESNNVIIIKAASKGYEEAEPIIIQGHMDMVCEKEKDCAIDFEKEGLSLRVDGDFVRAEKTTLGGDDGVAVCYALALLEAEDIAHPRLEVVLTVDEEIGMLGAAAIDVTPLKGHIMLNIDSDEEGHFLTGCAGGMSIDGRIPVKRITKSGRRYSIDIIGLCGGHSGAEIHKERCNADILMGRILSSLLKEMPVGLLSLSGGLKDNAIPRESHAEVLIPEDAARLFTGRMEELNSVIQKEYIGADPNLRIQIKDCGFSEEKTLDASSLHRILFYLRMVPNGVQNRSQVMEGLVETSINLGIMELKEDTLYLVHSLRSCVESRKKDLMDRMMDLLEMAGGEGEIQGDYPAWEYRQHSLLRERVQSVYEELYGTKPIFETIHAGLECGIFSKKIPGLDCVSFGPDNFDIHTPRERLSIPSTARIWDFLVEFLKQSK